MTRVYLAGPEVFLPDAAAVIAAKCDLTRAAGLIPVAPGDAQVPDDLAPFDKGLFISRYDEALMDSADAVIANLTPFRGISADVGTAYELGFMAGRGKPVFAYTNDARPHADRIGADGGGFAVERFAMADNLMLHGGVARRGATLVVHDGAGRIDDLAGFRVALGQAAAALLG